MVTTDFSIKENENYECLCNWENFYTVKHLVKPA